MAPQVEDGPAISPRRAESYWSDLSAVSANETDSGFLLAEGFDLIAVT